MQHVKSIAIGGRYHLLRKLGSGSFGHVYLGMNLSALSVVSGSKSHIPLGRDAEDGIEVAMKFEHRDVAPSLLEEEAEIYHSLAGQTGFTQVYWHGHQDDYIILVFELLGPNLEDLFRYCGNQFSLKTTLLLADQLLLGFKSLHSNNYLHRDVKPENFLLGMSTRGNTVYMADLGLAIYRDPDR